jgi:hypothetical protein
MNIGTNINQASVENLSVVDKAAKVVVKEGRA